MEQGFGDGAALCIFCGLGKFSAFVQWFVLRPAAIDHAVRRRFPEVVLTSKIFFGSHRCGDLSVRLVGGILVAAQNALICGVSNSCAAAYCVASGRGRGTQMCSWDARAIVHSKRGRDQQARSSIADARRGQFYGSFPRSFR